MSSTVIQRDIRPLTGVRGIAACIVMVFHVGSAKIGGPLMRNGYLAVDLFFILSGFVMALTYTRNFEGNAVFRAYREFLIRRIARIYPLYVIATVIMGSLIAVGADDRAAFLTPRVVVANLVMMQTWLIGPSLDPVAWSISTEWAAYLLFPLLVCLPLSRRAWIRAASCGACLSAICMVAIFAPEAPRNVTSFGPIRHGPMNVWNWSTPWPLIRCLAEFTLGMLVWRVFQYPALAKQVTARLTSAVAIVTCILWCVPRADLATVLAFAVLIGCLSFGRGLVAKWLGSSIPHALGEWSYAIYLVHPIAMLLIAPGSILLSRIGLLHVWTFAAIMVVPITIAVSCLLHHVIEIPARTLVRQTLPRAVMT